MGWEACSYVSYVSKFESGEGRLDVIEFVRVARAMRIRPTDVLRQLR